MNISTGISEIRTTSFSGASPVKNKTFIWPAYTDGKVEKIQGAGPRSSEPIYYKSTPEQQNKIFDLVKNSQSEYNASGRTTGSNTRIQPGSLFNAIA